MGDLTFMNTDQFIASSQRGAEEIQRETLKRKLKNIADDTERATDACRRLMQIGGDVTDELNELETTARGLLLVALLLKREATNG